MNLPKPTHKYGYPLKQIKEILEELGIDEKEFNKAFGVNTVGVDEKTDEHILYPCDVERALWKLGSRYGKWYPWD